MTTFPVRMYKKQDLHPRRMDSEPQASNEKLRSVTTTSNCWDGLVQTPAGKKFDAIGQVAVLSARSWNWPCVAPPAVFDVHLELAVLALEVLVHHLSAKTRERSSVRATFVRKA